MLHQFNENEEMSLEQCLIVLLKGGFENAEGLSILRLHLNSLQGKKIGFGLSLYVINEVCT